MAKKRKPVNPQLLEEYDPKELSSGNPTTPVLSQGQEVFVDKKAAQRQKMEQLLAGEVQAGTSKKLILPSVSQFPGVPQLPSAPKPQTTVIQMNGGASPNLTGQNFNVPAPRVITTNQPRVTTRVQQPDAGVGYTGTAGYWGGWQPSTQASTQTQIDPFRLHREGETAPQPINRSRPGAYVPPAMRDGTGTVNPYQATAADGTPSPPVPQSSSFDPNDENSATEWRTWWNWHASHPVESRVLLRQMAIAQGKPDPFAVHVPTREEIWQMKAEQRRRRNNEDVSSGAFSPSFVPQDYNFGIQESGNIGNQIISASWRIGG